jgi:hypothetical protein
MLGNGLGPAAGVGFSAAGFETMGQKVTLDDVCRQIAVDLAPLCEAAGYKPMTAVELMDMVAEDEELRVAALNARLQRRGGRPERKLLRDEKGEAWGEIEMEIPLGAYANLADRHNKRFGPEAVNTPEGRKEILKAFPEFGVKTVIPVRVNGANFDKTTKTATEKL